MIVCKTLESQRAGPESFRQVKAPKATECWVAAHEVPSGTYWPKGPLISSDHEVMTSAMIIPDLCLQDWSKDGSQMSLG